MWRIFVTRLVGHPSAAMPCRHSHVCFSNCHVGVRVAGCRDGVISCCRVTHVTPMVLSVRASSSQAGVRQGRTSRTRRAAATLTVKASQAQHVDTVASALRRDLLLQSDDVAAADDADETMDDRTYAEETIVKKDGDAAAEDAGDAPSWGEVTVSGVTTEPSCDGAVVEDVDTSGAGVGHDGDADEARGVTQPAVHSKQLADVFPAMAAEYVAAGAANSLPLEALTTDAAVVVAWCCATCKQIWRCGVFVRCVLGTECPHCSAQARQTVAARRPDLLRLWDVTRNDPFLSPDTLRIDSASLVFWQCPTCHQGFAARVRDMVKGKAKCPSCALTQIHSTDELQRAEGVLLQEWHPLKNGDLRFETLQPTDNKTKVWWLCSVCGHDWQASLVARLSKRRKTQGRLCPACQGKSSVLDP